jgi:glutamate synthase (NADPH/NADH) small chain
VPKVFAAGDMTRGPSLVVWAIADGRRAAKGVDKFLMGETVAKALVCDQDDLITD